MGITRPLASAAAKIGLVKNFGLEDIYDQRDKEGYYRGISASTMYRRIGHVLCQTLGFKIYPYFHQWNEERSRNHHRYALTTKWPVGIININDSSKRTQEIINCPLLNEFDLGIHVASNSSGGIKENKIHEYEFSLYPGLEEIAGTYRKELLRRSYEDVSKKLAEKFQDNEEFRPVSNLFADYVCLEGFDEVSGGKIFIQIGNIPALRKKPKIWSKKPIDLNTMPPRESVKKLIFPGE